MTDQKFAEWMERLVYELHELNTTLNCRFDALDDIVRKLEEIDASCYSTITAVGNTLKSANDKFYEDY
jgi:hypothetical protein